MTDDSTKPKLRRRWLRYSLRSLLLAMLILSIWLGYMANQAAKKRRAVAFVKELGGSVLYDCQIVPLNAKSPRPRPPAGIAGTGGVRAPAVVIEPLPEGLLYDLLGVDWFHDVERVVFSRGDVTDEKLRKVVESLPNVEEITFYNCSFTDAALQRIASLKNLRRLILRGGVVTADGVAQLKRRLPDLKVFHEP